jgi:AcrR family transcriptional regulator
VAPSAPDPEDLTARARIRDAALRQFGENGFERATIRGIAEAAGVSSGLVRHHFGSKQALREACDAYLSKVIRDLNDQARADPTLREVNHVAAAQAAVGPHQRYLARALAEGAAGSLFDEMVRMTQDWLVAADQTRPDPPEVDLQSRATVITAMALSVSVLHEHVARGLGVDLFSPQGAELLARTVIDIYSHPLMSLQDAASALAGLDRLENPSRI